MEETNNTLYKPIKLNKVYYFISNFRYRKVTKNLILNFNYENITTI